MRGVWRGRFLVGGDAMSTDDLSDLTSRALAAVVDLHDAKAVCDALHWAGLSVYAIKYTNLVDVIDRERMRRSEESARAMRGRPVAA